MRIIEIGKASSLSRLPKSVRNIHDKRAWEETHGVKQERHTKVKQGISWKPPTVRIKKVSGKVIMEQI